MRLITLLFCLFLSFGSIAKTVIALNKTSSSCSVAFESKASSKRIDGQKYLRFKIQDIKLSDLYMAKGSLESSVDSQWLNTGERYYISAYVNSSIGPRHIPIDIPPKDNDYNRYVDIDIDKYLPCSCFSGADKPARCIEKNYHDITFKDRFGNWWQQTGKDSAKRIGNKIGESSHKVWDTGKQGVQHIKDGWNNYQEK
jgi:hypothetical protein